MNLFIQFCFIKCTFEKKVKKKIPFESKSVNIGKFYIYNWFCHENKCSSDYKSVVSNNTARCKYIYKTGGDYEI